VLLSKIYNTTLSNATSTIQAMATWVLPPGVVAVGDTLRITMYSTHTGAVNGFRHSVALDGVMVSGVEQVANATAKGMKVTAEIIVTAAATQVGSAMSINFGQAVGAPNGPSAHAAPLVASGGTFTFRGNWNAAGTVDTVTLVLVTVELVKARG
jgi:hypothetical protein